MIAVSFGLLPSIVASIAGVLALDNFFVPPLYTFEVTSQEDVVALGFFVVVALTTSSITARSRSESHIARNRARVTTELYSFIRELGAQPTSTICSSLPPIGSRRCCT